ncbi:GNAT family N-acetyltransferase [Maribacter algarum]|uniref:GNAT family N-acetyltransferase n=1 Tax=Maribacter algarum (ex Zhang et al. 2020) TaxID=2578118 RepID=A0A5S3PSA2_9FLAO|nr:GNAT family N-acetyltransferase [Maribacter algarum]TMM57541.1 GNAT family N-acetyltransferase [Maribacter algarum]
MVWPLRHEVMWPDMPFDFVKLPEDSNGTHFGLFVANELVSIASLFKTGEGIAQFRKFATKIEEQGKGYGTKLLLHLIENAQEKGFHTLWCNARVDKTNFYKKFGMLETEKTYTKQNIKFVILRMVL